jgi:predicted dehydrogenase
MTYRVTRRKFLGQAAVTSAVVSGYFVNPAAAQESKSPNEKLNLAFVGVGNKGWHNVEQLASQNVVALCDVDTHFLGAAASRFPHARQHRDYRKMLDRQANQMDGVVVSTPDHMHAPITSAALDLGKHVYCEKPLTHTVREARHVAELAAKKKVATQMGTQIHAENNYRRVVELIQAGSIGKVGQVFTWCNTSRSNGRFVPWDKPVPEHVDWDLWLGAAKSRPYSPGIHPFEWRKFWEYGSGTFGDMACHVMDLPYWALKLGHPKSVAVEGPPPLPDGAALWIKADYVVAVEGGGTIQLHWSDGGAHHDLVKNTLDYSGQPLSSWGLGALFVGDKGMLVADYGRHQLLPKQQFEGFKPPPQTIPRSIGHWNEWVQACKTGSPTTCNFQYSGMLTETVLLGIVAYRTGQALQWDPHQLIAPNCSAAEAYLTKKYRQGFEVVGMA